MSTVLLSHFNGTNLQTTYTATTGQVFTFFGDAKLSTTQKKFGTTSLALDGSGDYIQLPDSATWDYTNQPFTEQAWVWFSEDKDCNLWGQDDGLVNPVRHFRLYSHQLQLNNTDGGDNAVLQFHCTFTPTLNQFYHLAVVRIDAGNAATSWRIFVNGVSQALTKDNGAWNATLATVDKPFGIGSQAGSGGGGSYLHGYIDEFKISNTADYTNNFTPPIHPFGFSSMTQGMIV